MQIIYLLDRQTLEKLYKLLLELREKDNSFIAVELMKHDSFKKIGRRINQIRWGN